MCGSLGGHEIPPFGMWLTKLYACMIWLCHLSLQGQNCCGQIKICRWTAHLPPKYKHRPSPQGPYVHRLGRHCQKWWHPKTLPCLPLWLSQLWPWPVTFPTWSAAVDTVYFGTGMFTWISQQLEFLCFFQHALQSSVCAIHRQALLRKSMCKSTREWPCWFLNQLESLWAAFFIS